VTTAMKGNYIF